MADIRLPAVIVQTATVYTLQLAPGAMVGQVARYLSQQEGYIEGSTLEIARRVPSSQRLADVDMQMGDRLVIFLNEPAQAELTPLNPGDTILKVIMGDVEISSHGTRTMLVGRTDEASDIFPDVDLQPFVSPRAVDFISRRCVQLLYDDKRKGWTVKRLGKSNRVLIDEVEVSDAPFPVNTRARLRIYRLQDDPHRADSTPLAELELRVEQIQASANLITLQTGRLPIPVRTGMEKETLKLNASSQLMIEQIAQSLLTRQKIARDANYRIYLLSLIPPHTPVGSLALSDDEFFYAARSALYTQSKLILRDIHNREQEYELVAGRKDEEKFVGRRSLAEEPDPRLDVDLYQAANHLDAPEAFKSISRKQMRILYKVAENTWWARLEERTAVPVYVNNLRLTSGVSVQLLSGDVLTFGPSIEQYYARLEVEVITRVE